MGTHRQDMADDLGEILEGDFGQTIAFMNPADGSTVTVQGQDVRGTRMQDPETGMDIFVKTPVVTVRNSRFTTLPAKGWGCRIRASVTDATTVAYVVDRVAESGKSFGWTKCFLSLGEQP